jgi:acetylornithine/succinyldiaminopimelate/putrescine aminotransferase
MSIDHPQYTKAEAIADFESYVSPQKVATYRALGFDFVPGRREGVRIWDLDGSRCLINLRSSGGVFNLGHRPARLVEVLREALQSTDVGDHILMSAARARLARRLAELTPGDIQYTIFSSSGGEAIDVALKLARGYTKKAGVISAIYGYHGHTGLALAATHGYSEKFGPLAPGFRRVPFADADALQAALDADTAAVIMETIPATAGFVFPPDNYYQRVRELCDQAGAVLILDEVQAGLGRTGRLWAIDEWGIVPDILVLGKGMSGGLYPMSTTSYRPFLQSFFDDDPFVHLSSFGGSDLGCIVTHAMLDEVSTPQFLAHVNEMGERFAAGFARLQAKHPAVVHGCRQKGLMIALVLADQRCGPAMTAALVERGVLALFANYDPAVLQVMPPLIISAEEVDTVLEAMDGAVAAIGERLGLLLAAR